MTFLNFLQKTKLNISSHLPSQVNAKNLKMLSRILAECADRYK